MTAREGAGQLDYLKARGAPVALLPLLHTRPTGEAAPIGVFDAVLLSSAATLEFAQPPPGLPVAAVGLATAEALGVPCRWVGRSGLRALVETVRAELGGGARLLHMGARQLADEAAASDLVRWAVYDTALRCPTRAEWAAVGPVAVVTLASPSAAQALVESWPGGPWPRVAVIGATTAAAARDLGLPVDVVADRPAAHALAAAALALLQVE